MMISGVMALFRLNSIIMSNTLPSPAPIEAKTNAPGMMPINVANT